MIHGDQYTELTVKIGRRNERVLKIKNPQRLLRVIDSKEKIR